MSEIFQSNGTISVKNNTFTLGQPVYPAEIVNFVPLIREHPEKDTVNQYFPHTIFLVFFLSVLSYLARGKRRLN